MGVLRMHGFGVLLVLGSLALSTCGSSSSSNPPAGPCPKGGSPVATTSVTAKDFSFDPVCISVAAGSKVTWTNTGMASHTVTSDTGAPVSFDSGAMGTDGIFEFTFASPGTVNYHCTPHVSLGMTGTVIVQ
jgi:plastocyanin